jgi:hypothetical protein
MAVELPPNYMAVALHHTGGSVTGEMVNTFAFEISGHGGTPQQALNLISQFWADGPHQRHVGAILYLKATAMYHDPVFGNVALESVTGSIVGSASGAPIPMNVAVIVQKTTGFAGRKFRGRIFYGGFNAAVFAAGNPNELDVAEQGVMQDRFDTFKSDCETVEIIPVLLHQVGGPTPTLITSFDVHALVGTVRKRIR